MSNLFFPKLALINIKKNGKFYLPYLLTGVGTVAMFYIMCEMSKNEGLKELPGSDALTSIMMLGTIIIGIFAVIFLFYTNSFLMKRRKKEIGLYNILGMEKRHISKILFFESIIVSVICLGLGLGVGILFDKLVTLLLFKLLKFHVSLGFSISVESIVITIILFGGIFFMTLMANLFSIKIANPIELLKGKNVGEKEPKTKIVMAIIGFITLAVGYYIALVTDAPLQALNKFFFAVLLVIIGTYCLFTAGSIFVLKLLRKNKKYYYQPKNFNAVAGMIYRMKQNAVGLANICILSTMVLVMVSTTVCLYIGAEDEIDYRYPTDVATSVY